MKDLWFCCLCNPECSYNLFCCMQIQRIRSGVMTISLTTDLWSRVTMWGSSSLVSWIVSAWRERRQILHPRITISIYEKPWLVDFLCRYENMKLIYESGCFWEWFTMWWMCYDSFYVVRIRVVEVNVEIQSILCESYMLQHDDWFHETQLVLHRWDAERRCISCTEREFSCILKLCL